MFFVYILYSEKLDVYYKGYTNSVFKRLHRHNSGYEKYTSRGIPWNLILVLPKSTKSEAMVLERKLKNLNRVRLESFILKYKESSQDDQ
ncbi:GIY-YIG nuclease family protein [Formosa sp. S-31]|uniref:GIY-YIG nuclease family protein n=1 Tax=Formosa sp. S-31 TaxID=2790949 RepID=UPI003EB8229B